MIKWKTTKAVKLKSHWTGNGKRMNDMWVSEMGGGGRGILGDGRRGYTNLRWKRKWI